MSAVGTSVFVAADSEAEALRRGEAKYAGRNPRATRAVRTSDGRGWTVSVTVDRPETNPDWGNEGNEGNDDPNQALRRGMDDRRMIDEACR